MSHGHIGQEGCLSETYCYTTVVRTCSLVKLAFCRIGTETRCERRLEKGVDKLWGDGEKPS